MNFSQVKPRHSAAGQRFLLLTAAHPVLPPSLPLSLPMTNSVTGVGRGERGTMIRPSVRPVDFNFRKKDPDCCGAIKLYGQEMRGGGRANEWANDTSSFGHICLANYSQPSEENHQKSHFIAKFRKELSC